MRAFSTSEFNIVTAIFEARFLSSLITIDKLTASKLVKKLKKIIPEANYQEDFINFTSKENFITGNILLDKIGMSADRNVSLKKFQDHIIQFVPPALHILEIESLARMGYRVQFVSKKVSMEESLLSIFNLYNFTTDDLSLLGKVGGVGLRLASEYRNLKLSMGIMPGFSQIIEIKDNVSKTQVEYGVMFDCDVFQDKNVTINPTEFLRDADNYIRNNVYPVINGFKVKP
jgi:hypothetical protein